MASRTNGAAPKRLVPRVLMMAAAGAVAAVGLSSGAPAQPPFSSFVSAERICTQEGGAFILDDEFAGAGYVCGWGRNSVGPRRLGVAEHLCRNVYGGKDFWFTQVLAVSYSRYVEP